MKGVENRSGLKNYERLNNFEASPKNKKETLKLFQSNINSEIDIDVKNDNKNHLGIPFGSKKSNKILLSNKQIEQNNNDENNTNKETVTFYPPQAMRECGEDSQLFEIRVANKTPSVSFSENFKKACSVSQNDDGQSGVTPVCFDSKKKIEAFKLNSVVLRKVAECDKQVTTKPEESLSKNKYDNKDPDCPIRIKELLKEQLYLKTTTNSVTKKLLDIQKKHFAVIANSNPEMGVKQSVLPHKHSSVDIERRAIRSLNRLVEAVSEEKTESHASKSIVNRIIAQEKKINGYNNIPSFHALKLDIKNADLYIRESIIRENTLSQDLAEVAASK